MVQQFQSNGRYAGAIHSPQSGFSDSGKKLDELEQVRDSIVQMFIQDLKDPLTVIQGSLQYVLEECRENKGFFTEKMEKSLQTCLMHCRRQMNLINDFIDINQMDFDGASIRKNAQSLQRLIESSVMFLEPFLQKKNLSVKTLFQSILPLVWCDETIIKRVVDNLLLNSIKFSKPGGTITVLLNRISGGQLECVIEDSGLPIPGDAITKIFSKFFKGDSLGRFRKGQGFGLAFCKMAVEAHGGKIWAERWTNGKNRFIFLIPVNPVSESGSKNRL